MIILDLIVVAILVTINAFYVAGEFSSVSVQKGRIRKAAEEGGHFAKRLLPYIEDSRKLDEFVAACQIGITWSSLMLGAYAQAMIAPKGVPIFMGLGANDATTALASSSLTVLVLFSIFQILFGELVPKSIAMQHPRGVALATVYPMIWSMKAYAWFITLLNGSAWAVLRLFRVPLKEGYRHIHSPDEIALMIGESREAGLLEPREHKRLMQVLEMSDRTVADLMIPRNVMEAMPISTTVDELMNIIIESPYTRIPVWRNNPDNIVGFVHTREIVKRHAQGKLTSIEGVLHAGLQVRETLPIEKLLTFMREYRSHMAFVVDQTGAAVGMITLDDLLKEFFGRLPEELQRGPAHD